VKKYEVVKHGVADCIYPNEERQVCLVRTFEDIPEYEWSLVDASGKRFYGIIICPALTEENDYRNFSTKGIPASVRKKIKEECDCKERIRFFYCD